MLKGIEAAPTNMSATAMLANKMFEFVCNSPLFDTALITRMFRKMVTGQAMPVMMEALGNVVESLKIHVNTGWYGQ